MSPRGSAADRRGQLIHAAMIEFSVRGLEGTSTADIARRAEISQPYLFRLFPTKKDLFIEACKHNADRVIDTLTQAAQDHYGHEALEQMARAYLALLDGNREILAMRLQQYAACHDQDIRTAVSTCEQNIWQAIEDLSGAPLEARVDFLAQSMLCDMVAAVRGSSAPTPQWTALVERARADDGTVVPVCSLLSQTG
jgi:AcrR family transcriptional regulator